MREERKRVEDGEEKSLLRFQPGGRKRAGSMVQGIGNSCTLVQRKKVGNSWFSTGGRVALILRYATKY